MTLAEQHTDVKLSLMILSKELPLLIPFSPAPHTLFSSTPPYPQPSLHLSTNNSISPMDSTLAIHPTTDPKNENIHNISPPTQKKITPNNDTDNNKLSSFGQNYSETLLNAHQLLSRRGTALTQQCDTVTNRFVGVYKTQSKQITQVEEYYQLLSTALPIITTSIQDLIMSLNELNDVMGELETERDEWIVAKNRALIDNYELKKKNDFESLERNLQRESNLLERFVKEQREKQVNKALEDFKKKQQMEYEQQLKTAFFQANDVGSTTAAATMASSLLSSSTATTPHKKSTSVPNQQTPTLGSQQTILSNLGTGGGNQNGDGNGNKVTFSLSAASPFMTKQSSTSSTTTAATTTTQSTPSSTTSTQSLAKSPSSSTPGLGAMKSPSIATTAAAIDLLEKYANGVPEFDDDFIQ